MKSTSTLHLSALISVLMLAIVIQLADALPTLAVGMVSVAKFGALPNGAGDATVAIQQAVDFAHAHHLTEVVFSAGVYKITKTILLYRYDDLCLRGAVQADGLPATIIEVQLADSYSPCFVPFNFVGGCNVAARNFVFTCSKPVDMVAQVVAVAAQSVKILPLPRYRDGSEPFRAASDGARLFHSFTLFDLESSNGLNNGIWDYDCTVTKAPFSWKRVPGTPYLETDGLQDTPPVFVGEYLTWNYQRMWGGAGANFIKCTDVAAVNLQGLHWPGGLGYCWLCGGKIDFKDCYLIPQQGYYANGATGGSADAMACGDAFVTLDHLVNITGHMDDSYDSPYEIFGVMEIIDPQTIIVQMGSPDTGMGVADLPNTELNEEVWIVNDTPAGKPYRCRLEEKPQPIAPPGYAKNTTGWYRVRFQQAPPAALLQPKNASYLVFPRFCAAQLWIKHCVDLRSSFGGWHTHINALVENNVGLHEDTFVRRQLPYGGKDDNLWNKTFTVRNNEFIGPLVSGFDMDYAESVDPFGLKLVDGQPLPPTSMFDGLVGDPATPLAGFQYFTQPVRISGNIFANAGAVGLYRVKNPRITDNQWLDGIKCQLTSCLDPTITNQQCVTDDASVNYLPNGSFASGAPAPWQVVLGSATISKASSVPGLHGLTLPAGYQVVKAEVTGLRENTYYRFAGAVRGGPIKFKVSNFASFGGALYGHDIFHSHEYQHGSLVFRTFKGIHAVTLYIIRRGGTGEAYVDNLTLYRLPVAVPPEEGKPPFTIQAPLPASDGTYQIVDDIDQAIQWGHGWVASDTGINISGNLAYHNSLHTTTLADAGMTYAFTGSGIGIYANTYPGYGAMAVSIDGGVPETVYCNRELSNQTLVYRQRGLPLGRHIVRVRHLDELPINIDALRVYTSATVADPQLWDLLAQAWTSTDVAARAALIRRMLLALDAHTCNFPVVEKAALCVQALEFADTPEEKRQVTQYLGGIPSAAVVKLLAPLLNDPVLKDDVAAAMLRVGRNLPLAQSESLKLLLKQAFEIRIGAFADKYPGWVGSWQFAGPYLQAGKTGVQLFDVAFPPELADAPAPAWRTVADTYTTSFDPRAIDLMQVFGGDERIAYLRCQIFSPVKQQVSLESAADDGSKVWLNGKLVLNCPTFRLLDWPEHTSVTLEQGWNSVLVKVLQITGGWSEGLHIMADKDQPYQPVQFKTEFSHQ